MPITDEQIWRYIILDDALVSQDRSIWRDVPKTRDFTFKYESNVYQLQEDQINIKNLEIDTQKHIYIYVKIWSSITTRINCIKGFSPLFLKPKDLLSCLLHPDR